MRFKFVIAAVMMVAVSCSQYPDFSVKESDCYALRIINQQSDIMLKKDTAWYVETNGEKQFYADHKRIQSLFNTLKDIDIQGISSYNPNKDFNYTIEVIKKNGKVSKTLKFNPIASSPNLVGSCNGSDCYIVGIPGLNISPAVNFNSNADYWKNLSLLEISASNIAKISITNYADLAQSFTISTNIDTFVISNYQGEPLPIMQDNIRQWLGTLHTFNADEICPTPTLPDSLKLYQVSLTTKSGIQNNITFYKKNLPNGSPDFNKMWFISENASGTVKYFDYDILLVGVDYLK